MKLKRLKIDAPYRSLQAGFEIEFQPNLRSQTVDPICFVGPNGSGKSNLLEAVADIFYYLECDLLGYTNVNAFKIPIEAFEIEYYKPFLASSSIIKASDDIPTSSSTYVIKIVKELNQKPKYSLTTKTGQRLIERNEYHFALPKRIWGYSSGLNETLSLPFRRIDIMYLEQLVNNLNNDVNEIIQDNRLHFVDYETTSSLVLSIFLMDTPIYEERGSYSVKTKFLREKFGIEGLSSFKLKFKFSYRNKFKMPMEKAIEGFIDSLNTAFNPNYSDYKKGDSIELNIDLSTNYPFEVFRKLATDADGLYKYFEKLYLRNKYTIPWKRRLNVLYSPNPFHAMNNFGNVPQDENIFSISDVMVKMEAVETPIPLESISDGEFQALTVFGLINLIEENDILCLFDEPETHLNPKWKYEYINTINEILKQKDSQMLITTHDPIFISGLSKEQVILFNKKSNLEPDQKRWFYPDEDLKGKGVDAILTSEVFNLSTTLDHHTLEKLIERRKLLLLMESEDHDMVDEARLDLLNKELNDIDFNRPFDDPLYKEFIKAIDNLDDYTKIDLTEEEKKERQIIADSIIQKLNKQFPD